NYYTRMPKLVREKELLKRTAVVFKNYPKNKPRITRNSNKQNTQHINILERRENIKYLYTPIYMNEYQIYEETKREIIRKIKEKAPFYQIGIDIVGPLPKTSKGNKFIVVVVDYFTK